MLNPSDLTNAVVGALQAIPDLVNAMNGDPSVIVAYHYLYGVNNRLAEALYQIATPGILVAWEGTQGGNFSGYNIWKHKICCYVRAANVATAADQISYEAIFQIMVNGAVNGLQNIRYTNLLPNVDIMDTPSTAHLVDEDGMDYFKIDMIFPEIGDET